MGRALGFLTRSLLESTSCLRVLGLPSTANHHPPATSCAAVLSQDPEFESRSWLGCSVLLFNQTRT